MIDCGPEDIVYTDRVSGVHANFIADTVPEPDAGDGAKRWKDIWSAGQGVVEIKQVQPIEAIVEGLVREYHDTVKVLAG